MDGNKLIVCRNGECEHRGLIAGCEAAIFSVYRVPDREHAVGAAGQEPLAVTTERERRDLLCMPVEDAQFFPARCIPNSNLAVGAA